MFDAAGQALTGVDVTGYDADAAGRLIDGDGAAHSVRITRGRDEERPLALWLIAFDRALASY